MSYQYRVEVQEKTVGIEKLFKTFQLSCYDIATVYMLHHGYVMRVTCGSNDIMQLLVIIDDVRACKWNRKRSP